MKRCLLSFVVFAFFSRATGQSRYEARIDALLKKMTLEEKVGQLNQYSGDWAQTGPITKDDDKVTQIKAGQLGSMLNVVGVEHTRQLQEYALQSRLKIPLLFGQDVIHGFRTTFPIPLAEAASWDLAAIERSARIAASEASAFGIHWVFAPMVDIGRDPRWGRVMEGAGEDPYFGSLVAAARVKGFQGKGPGDTAAVLATAKHFAAYGAAVGGRDYNSVDMSNHQLWQIYLPPFKAALDAGVATFMNAFNDLNGIPATGNRYLQREILKEKWRFNGIVVSDWGSIGEMIQHGYAEDNKDAALKAITAGSDIDMESRSYKNHLAQLVKEGKVPVSLLDDAVKRVLRKKFELGLFDDPFRYSNKLRQESMMSKPAFREAARDMAAKSIVLLKNKQDLLPLPKQGKKIAVIGPIAKLVRENLGFWSMEWPDDSSTIVSQWEGIRAKLGNDALLTYSEGCGIKDSSRAGFAAAIETARQADVVVMCMGEARDMSGEAKSRSRINLPGVQEELIRAIYETGKPVVVMISAGRPLVFNWTADNVQAILYTWWLGSQAGNAIADVLFGDVNPSGRLPMSFPRSEGQIPIYYNYFNTGRPADNENDLMYKSAYNDLPNSPRFAFGYGLSYTNFDYSNIRVSKTQAGGQRDSVTVTVTLKNTGKVAGTETVQLYIRDKVASVVRPVKELKQFRQVKLEAGATKDVAFVVSSENLKFYNQQLKYDWEPGAFTILIGPNAESLQSVNIDWKR